MEIHRPDCYEDPIFTRVRQYVLQNVVHVNKKKNGKVTWQKKHDLLLREFFTNDGRVFLQLDVHQGRVFRKVVNLTQWLS